MCLLENMCKYMCVKKEKINKINKKLKKIKKKKNLQNIWAIIAAQIASEAPRIRAHRLACK